MSFDEAAAKTVLSYIWLHQGTFLDNNAFKDLDKDVDFTDLFFIGDVLGEINTVSVSFNLFKKKNQLGSKTKTRSVTVEAESYQPSQPASYPADLW